MSEILFSDMPIHNPDQDRYGIIPFARSLASSIETMSPPEGLVIALNGRWGSGKTSVINITTHFLNAAVHCGQIKVIRFNPWQISGEVNLTVAFLTELHTALGVLRKKKAQESVRNIAESVSGLASIGGTAAGLLHPVLAPAVTAASKVVGKLLSRTKSIESEFGELKLALEAQNVRFLFIIDDLDRLPAEESMEVFRLVKAVGSLPNVLYLLSFDRELAERIVIGKNPVDGPEYLEKIIQVSFDLPLPNKVDIRSAALSEIMSICGMYAEGERTRFANIFHDVVVPYLHTPRDISRLANALRVTWPPVANEVDLADYVAIQVLRLFEPKIYDRIRYQKDRLCGTGRDQSRVANINDVYENIFLSDYDIERKDQIRLALRRLFPRLDSVWSNTYYDQGEEQDWRAKRYVRSKEIFDTYFRFSLSEETLSISDINDLISHIEDQNYARKYVLQKFGQKRRNGGTYIPILLDELQVRGTQLDKAKICPLLSVFFELHDQLNVGKDSERGFLDHADVNLRIHWLVNSVFKERVAQDERSEILKSAMRNASLGWRVDFARRCISEHHRSEKSEVGEVAESDRIVDTATAEFLVDSALQAIRSEQGDISFLQHPKLDEILYRWSEFSSEVEVADWVNN